MSYAALIDKMIEYYRGDTKRIQHFLKVYSYASVIGELEKTDSRSLHFLRTAAIVHDIGIKICEEKYGECGGKLQELEGPPVAENMLKSLDFDDDTIQNVCRLIACHHTYNNIRDIDHQILVEADFLVNMCEDQTELSSIKKVYHNIFRTASGKKICRNLFGFDDTTETESEREN